MQGAPQRLWALSGAGQGGLSFQAQIRLHGTHRTRQGTGAWPRTEQSTGCPRELMPYCREMARLWGGGGHRKGRATYRTSNRCSPGSWENRTAKQEEQKKLAIQELVHCWRFSHAKLNISKQGSDGLGPLPSRVLWKAYSSQGHLWLVSLHFPSRPHPTIPCASCCQVYPTPVVWRQLSMAARYWKGDFPEEMPN